MANNEKLCGTCGRAFKEDQDFLTNTSQWRVCTAGNLWFNCDCGSTLMLPKGKFPWYSPGNQMSDAASSLFNKMSELQELPHIPTAIMELQNLLTNSETDISDLARSVKMNPFIAADVLKVCENLRRLRSQSGPAGIAKEDPSLEYAITFIGRKQLSSLVMVATVKKFQLKTKLFNPDDFWQHSFQIAAISEYLWVEFYGKDKKDAAFLAGCLSNIGKIVAALVYPEKSDAVCEQINNPKTQGTWNLAEENNDLYSHCILGEIGAAFWGFPGFAFEAIKFHHDPDENPDSDDPDLVHVISLSNILSHWINCEPHRFEKSALDREKKYFSIDDTKVQSLINSIKGKVEAA